MRTFHFAVGGYSPFAGEFRLPKLRNAEVSLLGDISGTSPIKYLLKQSLNVPSRLRSLVIKTGTDTTVHVADTL